MKRAFRHKIMGEKIYILKNGIGLFGPQLESIAVFDNKDGNLERVKHIVKTAKRVRPAHRTPQTMTEKEILEAEKDYSEAKIQHTCVCWFRMTFPKVDRLLFSVPNGGWRGGRAGASMVYEGQVKGVADLILLFPSGGKASLCIEMKVPKRKGSQAGNQSDDQKSWQELVERNGSVYVVCHGIIEFITAVCRYLRVSPAPYIEEALNKYPLYR